MSSVSLPAGSASAERAKSSPSLTAGWGLGGAGGVLCLIVGTAGPRLSRASSMRAERGLIRAGIVLCLVLGLAKQRLGRFIALFVGGRSLRHPHVVPPALEVALAGGAVRVEQRLLRSEGVGVLALLLRTTVEALA